jgi:hypothetical protein
MRYLFGFLCVCALGGATKSSQVRLTVKRDENNRPHGRRTFDTWL